MPNEIISDAPLDDYSPQGWDAGPEQGQAVPNDGWHLICARCETAEFVDIGMEKPYVHVSAVVTSPEYAGLRFTFRIYLHPKAQNWARYALVKGGYDRELLAANPPVIRCSAIVGLEWLLLVLITSESGFLEWDIKGFGHADEGDPDLERRYFRMRGQQPQAEESVDSLRRSARGASGGG